MGSLSSAVEISVAILILVILASTIMLPRFRASYNYPSCTANSTSLIACVDCNNTDTDSIGYDRASANCYQVPSNLYGYNGTHVVTAGQNGTHCWGCSNFGFRTSSQGLFLLVLALGLISFAVIFIPRIRL